MGREKDIQKNEEPTKEGKKKAKGHKRLFAVSLENGPITNLLSMFSDFMLQPDFWTYSCVLFPNCGQIVQ
ncbi:Hypothetical predicted protein [Mytilus galloprovincialis]|uniref:Uncharacterized protein n=1 Tax=Mytilus galloprovincialis TaxID=29158 RepID=A0A8B6HFD0_MYTGA|nr:Hypothetical predicted protein [Mytilus galloprovincialis]